MSDTIIDYSRLGWNIKCLREAFGETLDDLKNAIGANSTGPISYYESGKQVPSRETLLKIAKHYRVTANDLLNNDFSFLNQINLSSLTEMDAALDNFVMDTLLPRVVSEDATKSPTFAVAYKLHYYLTLLLRNRQSFDGKLTEHCLSFYKSADAEGIPEASANLLWWMFMEGITILGITPQVVRWKNEGHPSTIDSSDYIKKHYLWKVEDSDDEIFREIEDAKVEYIKEIDPEYIRLLKKLKQTPDYSDLADYYTALRYLLGLVDSNLTHEMKVVVGSEMIAALSKLENKYALNVIDKLVEMV